MGFSDARHYFSCRSCEVQGRGRVKAAKIEAIEHGEGRGKVRFPYPPETEWKNAPNRFRAKLS